MTREVDRLLAQLAHATARPEHQNGAASVTSSGKRRFVGIARDGEAPTRADFVGLWARVALGVALGIVMTQWPYPHRCDLPLAGYLAAVAVVIVTGGWIAFESWRMRSGIPHVLSLVLVFWGIVLGAEQLLPRIGYAAVEASWRCGK